LVAEKFEKWTKMKLLSIFQLATLFAKQLCTLEFLYLLRDDMNEAYGEIKTQYE